MQNYNTVVDRGNQTLAEGAKPAAKLCDFQTLEITANGPRAGNH
jgi:hypothetical protein